MTIIEQELLDVIKRRALGIVQMIQENEDKDLTEDFIDYIQGDHEAIEESLHRLSEIFYQ